MDKNYDFSGWVTRNDIRCADGRTIRHNAFVDDDGKRVPLVWNHDHNSPENVLGHVDLKNNDDGVYGYGKFNTTPMAQTAKEQVKAGDIVSLSIYANHLKESNGNVMHGAIREVSLVLAGANPGAYIDTVIAHSEDGESEAVIYSGDEISLSHADDEDKKKEDEQVAVENTQAAKPDAAQDTQETNSNEETLQDVFDTLTDKQKNAVYAIIGLAVEDAKNGGSSDEGEEETDEEGEEVKHNVFDGNGEYKAADTGLEALSHSEQESIIKDAKRYGSLKDSVLEHGIDQIDYLFPDAKTLDNAPSFIKREDAWVAEVMNGAHHTPFSRVKSIHANLTEDDARAKGYIKGKQKKEEVFPLLKRATTPTTIYKKQKMDRDDVVDITDFDVVAWLKTEMRMMLNEEIARAALVGDGRSAASDDKINEQNIRPIWTDDDLYTIKASVELATDATDDDKAKAFIRKAIKARKDYKGSGNPTLFTTEDMLTDCLLMEDKMGRVIYESADKLATAMRVSKIVTVPVMEDLKRTDSTDSKEHTLLGIIVNMNDYTMGADKGGEVNMFDDFDIDYNQQKYLIETRCSGALTTPYSAIAIESVPATTSSGAKSNG